MNPDQLSFLNPNYFNGCHPFALRSYFESDPFFENLGSAFPLNLVPEDISSPKLSLKQEVLERLLESINEEDTNGIYRMTDFEGGLLIRELSYSYPIFAFDMCYNVV